MYCVIQNLDSGLDYGLNFQLDFGLDSRTYKLASRFQAEYLIASSLVSKVRIIRIAFFFGIDVSVQGLDNVLEES